MANRRMFSLKIVDTDLFLDMPQSSQLLYYSLAMRADDDGFISNPKKIMRMIGSQDDDYKVLILKNFVIPFESGVCVIKHWLVHNLIRGDRYTETQFIDEKKTITIDKDSNKYDMKSGMQNVIPSVTPGKVRLGKVSKEKNTSETSSQEIPLVIKSFEGLNPASKKFYGIPTQRKACADLIETYTLERVISVIEKTLPKTNSIPYFPTITTPLQLFDKWATLESKIKQYQSEKTIKNEKYQII